MTSRIVFTLAIALPVLAGCGGGADTPVDDGEPAAPMTDAQQPEVASETALPGDDPAPEAGPDPGAGIPDLTPATPEDETGAVGDGDGGITDQAEVSDVTGRWAADPDWCTDQTSGFPVTITQDRFEGRENVCDIAELVDGGQSFTATLSCQAEGTTTTELVKMTPEDGTLTLTYLGRDDAETVLTRCLD